MLAEHFPLTGLRLTTPRLDLRLPTAERLAELAALAAKGIHDPAEMPFLTPFTDALPEEVARSVVQHHWRVLGALTPAEWALEFTVVCDGVVVGQQAISAQDFSVTREVRTGSWLGLAHQGSGLGTEMRAAVLHLAFAGLGAEEARTGAFEDNVASLAVSRKLGYADDGIARHAVRGKAVVERRMRLTRQAWQRHRSVPVTVRGLQPCLPLLGVDAAQTR
ncbi:GNAT family N-acetyltransferase [Prauserella oleivorans]|uniref:GNAT family N-acetyltransferase n=1 Tax=Prauserella oleivorans TaxID=1478153 RepID=A0ABW5W437_9PSEU